MLFFQGRLSRGDIKELGYGNKREHEKFCNCLILCFLLHNKSTFTLNVILFSFLARAMLISRSLSFNSGVFTSFFLSIHFLFHLPLVFSCWTWNRQQQFESRSSLEPSQLAESFVHLAFILSFFHVSKQYGVVRFSHSSIHRDSFGAVSISNNSCLQTQSTFFQTHTYSNQQF